MHKFLIFADFASPARFLASVSPRGAASRFVAKEGPSPKTSAGENQSFCNKMHSFGIFPSRKLEDVAVGGESQCVRPVQRVEFFRGSTSNTKSVNFVAAREDFACQILIAVQRKTRSGNIFCRYLNSIASRSHRKRACAPPPHPQNAGAWLASGKTPQMGCTARDLLVLGFPVSASQRQQAPSARQASNASSTKRQALGKQHQASGKHQATSNKQQEASNNKEGTSWERTTSTCSKADAHS